MGARIILLIVIMVQYYGQSILPTQVLCFCSLICVINSPWIHPWPKCASGTPKPGCYRSGHKRWCAFTTKRNVAWFWLTILFCQACQEERCVLSILVENVMPIELGPMKIKWTKKKTTGNHCELVKCQSTVIGLNYWWAAFWNALFVYLFDFVPWC